MKKIKLALCQMNVVDSKEKNLNKASSMIIDAVGKNVDFIVLPEMFNCPYSNEKFIEYAEEEKTSETLLEMSKLACKNNVYILAGSIPEKDGNNLFNTSYLFNRNGEIIAKHRKMHLFDIDVKGKITFKESDVLTEGDEFTIADTEFGKIGIGICYDIRFPELARIMAQEGASILFYPGAFNKDSSYHSFGHSIITNPWGDIIAEASEKESLIISEIDLSEIKKIREELPLLKNKREDLYEIIKK